jgi:small subunit ribosomal protein S16
MLVIRLQRTGRENTPTYRIVVSEKTKHAKKGAHEILGHYLPSGKQTIFKCDKERALYWISKGAIPSDTMARLLKRDGAEGMEKYIKRYAKQKSKKDPPPEAAPAAPAPQPKLEEAPAASEPPAVAAS